MDENVVRPKMPPEIAKAVVAVKKQVRQLGKDDENKFARFKYVSVDKFYDAIGRVMADAGLFVITDEMSVTAEKRDTQNDQGVVKSSMWLTATYELTLFHETGAEYGPIHRTIMVPATGPQAFGSGMSYVEKYFLRSLFKIPTGDQDADAEPQQGVPEGRGGKPSYKPTEIRAGAKSEPANDAARAQTEKTDKARAEYNRLVKGVRETATLAALGDLLAAEGATLELIKSVSAARYADVMAIFGKREDEMKAKDPITEFMP